MKTHNVSVRGIKVDPLAHELATSEGTQPYLDCLIKAYSNNAGLESALEVVHLPLERRYTWRVFYALKWAFADFEDEYVALDLPHIPEPTRSEMTKELELRFQQLQILLQTFHTEKGPDRQSWGGPSHRSNPDLCICSNARNVAQP